MTQDVPVCLRCKSRRVNLQGLQEGLVPGGIQQWVCEDCGFIGMPLLIDADEAPSGARPVYERPD